MTLAAKLPSGTFALLPGGAVYDYVGSFETLT
jgi:hypothetical protein